jgi:hypothetical protein
MHAPTSYAPPVLSLVQRCCCAWPARKQTQASTAAPPPPPPRRLLLFGPPPHNNGLSFLLSEIVRPRQRVTGAPLDLASRCAAKTFGASGPVSSFSAAGAPVWKEGPGLHHRDALGVLTSSQVIRLHTGATATEGGSERVWSDPAASVSPSSSSRLTHKSCPAPS